MGQISKEFNNILYVTSRDHFDFFKTSNYLIIAFFKIINPPYCRWNKIMYTNTIEFRIDFDSMLSGNCLHQKFK
jgi:hypothetical protein